MAQVLRILTNPTHIPARKRLRARAGAKPFNAARFAAGAFALLIGFTSPFLVHLVGEVPVAEIILPLILPVLIVTRRRDMFKPTMRTLLILLGVWLAGQIMTDMYRHTMAVDWIRGDANIVFFVMDLLVFVALLGKSVRRLVLYTFGFSVGKIFATLLHMGGNQQQGTASSWKFGYAPACILLVFLVCCFLYRRRNYAVVVLLLLAFCAVNVVLNFRSQVLFIFVVITMTVPVVPEQIGRLQLLPPEGTTARLLAVAALALCAGGVALGIIEFATSSGLLGAEAQAKNEKQAQAAGGILLGGRPEILVSSRAILESPILGYGSWPKDPKYVEMLGDIRSQNGIPMNIETDEETKGGIIPSHSCIFGAWVAAGVLGTLFWFYLLSPLFKAMVKISILRTPMAPLYAYFFVDLLWNIFFSPFAGNHRLSTALEIIVMINVLEAPMPALVKKTVSRFSGAWNGQTRWRPSVRI
jgi:O-antigen ligase